MTDKESRALVTQPVILIGGPTASGKTALAVELAKALDGEVVNVDSVQLYRELQIGSARPTENERQGVPHHMLDVLSPDEPGSAARYLSAALECIVDIQSRGKQCLLAGGTGMYVTALFHGLVNLPPRDEQLRGALEELSVEERFERLRSVDPGSADTLHPNDTLRVVRAIEVSELTGVPYSESVREHGLRERVMSGLFLIPCYQRDVLYDRIDRRSAEMVRQGLIDEVRGLKERYGVDAPALQSLGYAQTVKYLEEGGERKVLIEEIAKQTRRFAKRQMTFWRNEPIKRGWRVVPDQDAEGPLVGDTTARPGANRKLKGVSVVSYQAETLVERVKRRLGESFEQSELWYLDAAAL